MMVKGVSTSSIDKYHKLTKWLRYHGYEFHREAKGDHEIWIKNQYDKVTIPHHRIISAVIIANIIKKVLD